MPRKEEALLKEMIQLALLDMEVPSSRVRRMTFKINESRGLVREIKLSESYITGVLGISRRALFESSGDAEFQRMVLREHLLFESFWDKAKEFTKNIIKKNPISTTIEATKKLGESIEGVVVALTGAVNSGEDAVDTIIQGSISMASKGLQAIKKMISQISEKTKKLVEKLKSDKIKSFIDKASGKMNEIAVKIAEKVKGMMSASGWKGMFAALAGWLSVAAYRTVVVEKGTIIMQVLSGNGKEMLEASKKLLGELGDAEGEAEEPPDAEGEDGLVSKAISNLMKYFSGLAASFVTKAAASLGVEAMGSILGPVAWLNSAAKVFRIVAGGVTWVCEKITQAINRATAIKINPTGSSNSAA